nr:ATP-binding cassette domain-containing protein [uncultured Carboxylicivirga sp.]
MPYPIHIQSHLVGNITVNANQYTVIYTDDTQLINDFLQWIEGVKQLKEDKVDFVLEGEVTSGLYQLKKFQKVLRYELKNKLIGDYYQQRYHATENDDLLSLRDFLGDINDPFLKTKMTDFGIDKLLDEKMNMLSTGEFKKVLSIKAADERPKVLWVEEPGIGVDTESRNNLDDLFTHLAQSGTSVVVFTSTSKWPGQTANWIRLEQKHKQDHQLLLNQVYMPDVKSTNVGDFLFELNNIVVRYNSRNVLNKVNWKVKPKEKWALTGKNGAGKSTLLSIIYADNPQSYSNEVFMFGSKRGTGQSIWDIKERIAFYSSELHRYINKRQEVEDVIRSLVIQNPYKKRPMNAEELQFRNQLLNYFELGDCLDSMFYELSTVRQKLIILCGVLVKNTELLILDEPFQGFSDELVYKAQQLINKFTANRTLIMVSHDKSFPENINQCFHLENGVGQIVSV